MPDPIKPASMLPPMSLKAEASVSHKFELVCTRIETMDAPVTVLESSMVDGRERHLPHDCMRKVTFAYFERLNPGPETHPKVEIALQLIGENIFSLKGRYTLELKKNE